MLKHLLNAILFSTAFCFVFSVDGYTATSTNSTVTNSYRTMLYNMVTPLLNKLYYLKDICKKNNYFEIENVADTLQNVLENITNDISNKDKISENDISALKKIRDTYKRIFADLILEIKLRYESCDTAIKDINSTFNNFCETLKNIHNFQK